MEKKLKKPHRKFFFRRIKIVMKSPLRGRIKKVITIPGEGLNKEEEQDAINRIIRKFHKLSKSLCSICDESLRVKLNLHCNFCRNFIEIMEFNYGNGSQDVFLRIHSKRGIRNSYNNCYLSIVMQSIMGTEL